MKKLIAAILILQFTFPAFAQQPDLTSTSRKVDTSITGGSVYYSGNYPGAVLMRVNLLGEVQKPGVHHMPIDTDFNTALGFAGGTTRFADTDRVVIKRKGTDGKESVIPIDLDAHFREIHKQHLQLKPNDTLYVPHTEGVISDNTMRVVMVLSLVVGTILSAISINNMTDGKSNF